MNLQINQDDGSYECPRCVMSSKVDEKFALGNSGLCLGCESFESRKAGRWNPLGESDGSLDKLVDSLREAGRNSDWDCVLGVSGGVDSSFLALKLKELGLRVYAVHVDNGWNSQTSVANIHAVLNHCNFPLETVILHAPTFYDLQKSFLLASVPDLEIPTDHAIQAVLWKTAREKKIPTIVSGMNFATESAEFEHWAYGHSDWRYIHAIWARFGSPKKDRYPHFSYLDLIRNNLSGTRIVSVLNYLDFNKEQAIHRLSTEASWKPYGGKHYESVYTRWVQGHLLPQKFGIDKRFAHVSDRIRSGQLTRQEALLELASSVYPEDLRYQDQLMVMSRFGLEKGWIDTHILSPAKSFHNYPNNRGIFRALKKFVDRLRAFGLYPR